MIAREEVGRKASAETAVARMEVVEVLGERGTGSKQLWVWMKVRVKRCWTKLEKACLGPNVSKMMKGLVVVRDASVVVNVLLLDMVVSTNIADSPSP